MKKILSLFLAFALLFSLSACDLSSLMNELDSTDGLSQTDPSGEETNQTDGTEPSSGTEAATGEMALADALEVYGFSEDDYKPEGFKELNTYSLMGKAGEIQSMLAFCVALEGEPTEDSAKAFYQTLYDKLLTLSDTDKLYGDMQGAQELTSVDDAIAAAPTLTGFPAISVYYPCPIGENRTFIQFKVSYTPDDNSYSVFVWVMNYLR